PIGGAVEEVDRRPQQLVEVGLEPGVAQGRDEGVEDVGERALDPMFLGQGTGVGLVPMGAIAEELQRVDDAGGGGRGVMRFAEEALDHGPAEGDAFSSAPGADFSSGSFSACSTSSPASSPSQIRSWPRCGLTLFLGAALVASGILRIYLGFNMQHESP